MMQRSVIKTLAAFAVVTGLFTATACSGGGGGGGGSSEQPDDSYSIGLVMKDTTNPYFRAIAKGATATAEESGAVLTEQSPQSEADIQGQIAKVQAFIAQGVDAIVIAPDGVQLVPVLNEAVAAGIKVVLVDAALPEFTDQTAFVGTDNVAAGKAGIDAIVELGDGDPKAGLIGFPGSPPVEARMQGATEALEALGTAPVQEVNGKADQAVSQSAVEDMIRAHPDMNAVFSCCGASGLGAAQAQRTSGADLVVVVIDGGEALFQAVKDGGLDGAIELHPQKMGEIGVQTALDALAGKDVEKVVDVQFELVTADNVDDFLE